MLRLTVCDSHGIHAGLHPAAASQHVSQPLRCVEATLVLRVPWECRRKRGARAAIDRYRLSPPSVRFTVVIGICPAGSMPLVANPPGVDYPQAPVKTVADCSPVQTVSPIVRSYGAAAIRALGKAAPPVGGFHE